MAGVIGKMIVIMNYLLRKKRLYEQRRILSWLGQFIVPEDHQNLYHNNLWTISSKKGSTSTLCLRRETIVIQLLQLAMDYDERKLRWKKCNAGNWYDILVTRKMV